MTELKTHREALEFRIMAYNQALEKRVKDGGVGLDILSNLDVTHDALHAHTLQSENKALIADNESLMRAANIEVNNVATLQANIDKVLGIIKYIDPLDESTFMKNSGLYRDPNGRWGITTEIEAMGVTVSGLDGTGSSWWHFDSGEGIGGVPCFIEFDDLIQAILLGGYVDG